MSISQNTKAQSLDDFQWKNRILLLVDIDPDAEALKLQLKELTTDKKELKERDLIIFLVTPSTVYLPDGNRSQLKTEEIYDEFSLDSSFKGTVLIGKDGGSKLKEPFVVSSQKIFDLIDSMPMRRAEMRKADNN